MSPLEMVVSILFAVNIAFGIITKNIPSTLGWACATFYQVVLSLVT